MALLGLHDARRLILKVSRETTLEEVGWLHQVVID
jgi:hypothetical protein